MSILSTSLGFGPKTWKSITASEPSIGICFLASKVIDENSSSSGISIVVICFTLTFVPFKLLTKFFTLFGFIFISRINSRTAITHMGLVIDSGS
jgi:hypothetical protein